MSKEKQYPFSVSIPYELRDNQLWMGSITWPDRCPCCNEKDGTALGTYKLEHKARWSARRPEGGGSVTIHEFFPMEWEIPYCFRCQKHMKIAENSKWGIIAICCFIPLILTIMIDVSSDLLPVLLYALFITGGYALYQIILKTVVKKIQKTTCLDHNLVFQVSSPTTDDLKVVFDFQTEEYAQDFAELNMAELENNIG